MTTLFNLIFDKRVARFEIVRRDSYYARLINFNYCKGKMGKITIQLTHWRWLLKARLLVVTLVLARGLIRDFSENVSWLINLFHNSLVMWHQSYV